MVGGTVAVQSCGVRQNDEEQMKQAERIAQQFYATLNSSQKIDVLNLFSKDFYGDTDTATTLAFFKKAKNGTVAAYNLTHEEVSVNHLGSSKEKEIDLSYNVTYSSGHVAKETFVFILVGGAVSKIDEYDTDFWDK